LGIFSAHHQEFSAVHSALVSFIPVFDDRFQAESGWNCRAVQRTAPQGSPRTAATCIAATTPELIVGILNSVFFKF